MGKILNLVKLNYQQQIYLHVCSSNKYKYRDLIFSINIPFYVKYNCHEIIRIVVVIMTIMGAFIWVIMMNI